MIYAELSLWREIPGFAVNPIWTRVFSWLEQSSARAAEGIHSLGEEGFTARVMRYQLKERKLAQYENHRKTIDVQYTVSGAEGIEFHPLSGLTSKNDYLAESDTEHFETPDRGRAWIDNVKGCFVVIRPGEPHLPQLISESDRSVHKVVVKIPVAQVTL